MQPCSLQRAAAITITQTLVDRLRHLDITKEHDRVLVVRVLGWLAEDGYFCLSFQVLQDALQWGLSCWEKSKEEQVEVPVLLASMLALCWHVELSPWDASTEKCKDMLEVIGEFQQHQCVLKGQVSSVHDGEGQEEHPNEGKVGLEVEEGGGPSVREGEGREVEMLAPLPTKSLRLYGLKFKETSFLQSLVEKMPDLQHVSFMLPVDDTYASVFQALSQQCRNLEHIHLSYLDPAFTIEEIIPWLYRVPPHVAAEDLLQRLSEQGEELWQNIVPQFPKLRVLEIPPFKSLRIPTNKQLTFLTLLLQPKLEFLQGEKRPVHFDLDDLRTICKVWRAVHGSNTDPPALALKSCCLPSELDRETSQSEFCNLISLLGNLRCVDLFMIYFTVINEDAHVVVDDILHNFSSTDINAAILYDLPLPAPSNLALLQHLKVEDISISTINIILDCCPNLCTLSVTRVRPDRQYQEEKPLHIHAKLATLRINYKMPTNHESFKTPLLSMLSRVPHLRFLCFWGWITLRPFGYGEESYLESVLSQAALSNTPLLTDLKELCCLPDRRYGATTSGIIESYQRLAPHLPSLGYITMHRPSSKHLPLSSVLNSNIELRVRCKAEQAFHANELDLHS